jgi:hypothetical protein
MYRDLLMAAMQVERWPDDGPDGPSSEALVVCLTDYRDRLRAPGIGGRRGPPATGVAFDIALQIEYDLTLMRLCELLAIEHGVDRFDQPVLERQRLEEAVQAQGVDLSGPSPLSPADGPLARTDGESAPGSVSWLSPRRG